jgi:branched-chain amino acid transport system permease protein
VRAAALGYNVDRIRLAAYTVGGAGGGLAGFWFANNSEFVSPAILDWRGSGHLLVMVILGSIGPLGRSIDGRLVGAAAGATGLIVAEEGLALLTPHWPLLLGPVLVAAALLGRR